MTQAVIASIPLSSPFVPNCLENLIDKKISGEALNIMQKLIDWICMWFYCPYNILYHKKVARIHTFTDGTAKLYDATKQGIAGIQYSWENDYISLFDKRVYFNPNPQIQIIFSRQAFTNYVVVKDYDIRGANWFQIIEQETPRANNNAPMEKSWLVNANIIRYFTNNPMRNVYLVEQGE